MELGIIFLLLPPPSHCTLFLVYWSNPGDAPEHGGGMLLTKLLFFRTVASVVQLLERHVMSTCFMEQRNSSNVTWCIIQKLIQFKIVSHKIKHYISYHCYFSVSNSIYTKKYQSLDRISRHPRGHRRFFFVCLLLILLSFLCEYPSTVKITLRHASLHIFLTKLN